MNETSLHARVFVHAKVFMNGAAIMNGVGFFFSLVFFRLCYVVCFTNKLTTTTQIHLHHVDTHLQVHPINLQIFLSLLFAALRPHISERFCKIHKTPEILQALDTPKLTIFRRRRRM